MASEHVSGITVYLLEKLFFEGKERKAK